MKTFRTAEVSKICGVTLRQLQYWDETGLIQSKRQATNAGGRVWVRVYDRKQLEAVRRIAAIQNVGMGKQRLRLRIETLRRLLNLRLSVQVITEPTIIGRLLVVPRLPGQMANE